MADFSLSDIKALMGDGDANGIVWVLLIVLLMGGGSWGNRGQVATEEFVQNGFNFNDLQDQNRDIMGAITGGTAQAVATTNQTFHDTLMALNDKYGELARDIAALAVSEQQILAKENECCCQTLRAIDGVNYNAAMNTAAVNANVTATGQKILDYIQARDAAAQDRRIAQLEMEKLMQNVVRYPNGWTYNAGTSPFCGGCSCG